MQAMDLNGCSTCHPAEPADSAGCGCARGPLCKGSVEASSPAAPESRGRRFWRRRFRNRGGAHHRGGAPGVPTLAQLGAGCSGMIREVNGVGPLRRRLLEMGVLPGTAFRVERVAPLGDPIEIRVRGYALSLRRAEAAHILVEPER